MKRVLILFILSFVFVNSYSQIYQKPLLFGKEENRLHVPISLGIPNDTIILEVKKPYPAVAVKDGVLYTWNVLLQKWNPATGDTTNNNYPTTLAFNTANGVVTLGRNGLSSLTVDLDGRWALNSDVVHYSDSVTYYATQHDLDSVTRSINTIINNIDSVQDNTTFSDGLHKVGNNVVALHDEAHWNAYMFQGRFVSTSSPLNGQVYAWDSVGLQWKPTTITAGGTETDAIALAALIDSAAAIRADITSGSTPDLQAVTTVGAITTHNIGVSGAFASLYVYNPSTSAQAVLSINNTTGQGNVSLSTTAGLQGQLAPDILTSNRILLLPDASDTLANRAWVRSLLGGGGGGSTPTLQEVLTAGSGLTSDASIVNPSNVITLIAGDETWSGAVTELDIDPTSGFYLAVQGSSWSNFTDITINSTTIEMGTSDGTNSTGFAFTPTAVKIDGIASGSASNVLYYNPSTNEITYAAPGSGTAPTLDEVTASGAISTNIITLSGSSLAYFDPGTSKTINLTYSNTGIDGNYSLYLPNKTGMLGLDSDIYLFTPSSSADAGMYNGAITADDNYFYFKTSSGTWKRIAWTTF